MFSGAGDFDYHCRPFYSPREFSSVVLVGVNAAKAINQLADQVLAVVNPDSAVIVVGDFKHTCLSKALPRYKQHVDCPTRKDKTLDHCYTVYPLGKSDHNTVILIPLYRQKFETVKPVKKPRVQRHCAAASSARTGASLSTRVPISTNTQTL